MPPFRGIRASCACAAASPGLQVSRNPPAQSGCGRFQMPVLAAVRCAMPSAGTSCFRRGQRPRWIAHAAHALPEWREHAQAAALLVADAAWSTSRSPGRLCAATPRSSSAAATSFGDCFAARCAISFQNTRRRRRPRAPAPADDLGRRSPAQQHRRAARCPACLQGAQRLRQPPARRATERPCRWRAKLPAGFVEHVETDHRHADARGSVEGGVIGQAQIVAEPDDMGAGRSAGHQAVLTRKATDRSAPGKRRILATLHNFGP